MKGSSSEDLGFTYSVSKNDDLEIRHHGRFATRFSKAKGARLSVQLEGLSFAEQQLLMARLTGNYKRGNERTGKKHS